MGSDEGYGDGRNDATLQTQPAADDTSTTKGQPGTIRYETSSSHPFFARLHISNIAVWGSPDKGGDVAPSTAEDKRSRTPPLRDKDMQLWLRDQRYTPTPVDKEHRKESAKDKINQFDADFGQQPNQPADSG